MDLTPGSLLERGKYCIIDTLGRGGFGITYLAEQVMAKRKVCIKEFFPKDYYKRDEDTSALSLFSESNAEVMDKFKAKFIKEAQTIASLDHSNIIHIHDVFEENGTAYYVMEYVEGGSLRDIVKEQGPLSESDAKRYIRAVASALSYIHEQKINHLDVKPGNIMVRTKDDSAILIDFGLSKHYDIVGDQTSSTPVGISHGYAPIEQYTSGGVKEFSPSTDIYGLGATLYYLVTGEVPPHATDVGEEGLPKLPDHLSHGVCQAIIGSMQYWRKDRPQSIKEFLKLLDDEQGVVAPVAEATIINVETKSVDESTVINVEPKQTPQPAPKNEPKPKKSKRGLWLGIFLFVVAAVASFILFGGGSSKKEGAPKSAVATVDTLASSNDSLNLAKPKVDTLQLNDTPKEQPKEEAKPSEANTETETQPEPPTKEPKEEAKPSETKPVTKPEPPTKEDAKTVTQSNNEIWYTSSDGKVVKPYKEGKGIFGTEIESNTYKNGKGIIKFKGNVTTIGDRAFYDRDNLTSATIPNSVTTIGESAFLGCKSLKSVTIPYSVTTIGEHAFRSCSSLKEFKSKFATPDGRCLIVNGKLVAFAHAGITEYTIPYGVTTIGKWAFYGCSSLTSVTITNSVTTIGGAAFYNCESLKSVTIPNSVTTIGEWAFHSCTNLTSVTIPNSVTTIGERAFWGCESLNSVTIPNSVTTIGEDAFYNCQSLKSVTIPNSVKTIGVGAFGVCRNLKEFKSEFATPDGRCLIVNGKLVAFAPAGITEYTIPDSVTTIGEHAFGGCGNLTSVTIPNSVTTIGEGAFYYCDSLESVTIPNSVKTIGEEAFYLCESLNSVTIPNSVKTIGEEAFCKCNNLSEKTKKRIKSINQKAL